MFQGYVFVGSFNCFPTNFLWDIYAHTTHRVSYGGIKKTACSESPPKGGKSEHQHCLSQSLVGITQPWGEQEQISTFKTNN